MLIKTTIDEVEQYLDAAYQLTLDLSRSGYHIYTDGIKTKKDFEETLRKGIYSPDRELLTFVQNGKAVGWIEFFTIPKDKYLQTVIFSIADNTEEALKEFEAYCKEKYAGYTLYLGFPGENKAAIAYFRKNCWEFAESLWNNVVHLKQYSLREENANIIPVNRENYSDFRRLHAADDETYWNADRIYDTLEQWHIYMYLRDSQPAGALMMKCDSKMSEIFGIDFSEGIFSEEVYTALLTNAMNECKKMGQEHLCYFSDAEGQKAALKAGFTCVGQYILHTKTI